MYRSVGTNNLKRHPLTFSIILTLIAGMVLCAVPVQGISAQTSFFMQSGQPLHSARTADYRSGYAAQYSAVLRTLAGGAKPEFGSVGGEWKVLALARSGFYSTQSGYFSEYYAKIEKLVAANGSPKLHPQKSTENSRLIIALSSIGRDARSVAGFDLTAPLGDFNYVKKQGLNGVIFALIALDCNKNYGMSDIKSQCVDLLLSRECDGGGWALGLGAAEADITAMAITALAPYRKAAAQSNAVLKSFPHCKMQTEVFPPAVLKPPKAAPKCSLRSARSESMHIRIRALSKTETRRLTHSVLFMSAADLHTWQTAAQIQWQPNRLHMHFARTTDFFPGEARFTT